MPDVPGFTVLRGRDDGTQRGPSTGQSGHLMAFLTQAEAMAAGRHAAGTVSIAESALRKSAAQSRFGHFDVFVSHSIRDAQMILGVTRYLEAQGPSVYVDLATVPQLDRRAVTLETAAHCKSAGTSATPCSMRHHPRRRARSGCRGNSATSTGGEVASRLFPSSRVPTPASRASSTWDLPARGTGLRDDRHQALRG